MNKGPATVALSAALIWISALSSQSRAADFYQGKSIRLIVGLAAGGGYDTYSRAIARHLGKHMPGNLSVIVENMTGAGSVIAANYVYKAVKPEGLVIVHYLGELVLQQLMGNPGIEFDARKWDYLGAPAQDHFVVVVSKASGITDIKKMARVETGRKIWRRRSRRRQRRYSKNPQRDDRLADARGFGLQGLLGRAPGVQ